MKRFKVILALLFSTVIFSTLIWNSNRSGWSTPAAPPLARFQGFDNETGSDVPLVPNIVHYIRFNKTTFSFVDYICIRSAYLRQNPDAIYLHTNVDNFTGVYWNRLTDEPDLQRRIKILPIQVPSKIFGQPLSVGWRLFHGSDVARIRLLMKYGGIYLDNDVYVVGSLDKYRKFELAIGWDEGQFLGSQVIVAHRQARFLPLWLDTYRQYDPDKWYYNAGEKPTVEVLYKHPELVHRVKLKFGVHMLINQLYNTKEWDEWPSQDTIHLLMNHRYYLDPHFKEYPEFNEDNIKEYPYTFGRMASQVLDAASHI